MSQNLRNFGNFLVARGYTTENKVDKAVQEAVTMGISLIAYLGQHQVISYTQLAEAIADFFKMPLFDLLNYDCKNLLTDVLPLAVLNKHKVLPLGYQDKQLLLATADPSQPDFNEITFLSGLICIKVIVPLDQLLKILDSLNSKQLHASLEVKTADLIASIHSHDMQELASNFSDVNSDNAPVVKLLNKFLLDAIDKGASDLHFEPLEDCYRIRYRLDGIMYEISRQPPKLASFFTARLKVMANLNLSERRLPQDGSFKFHVSNHRAIDFRVSTCPTLHGEKVALRLLESQYDLLDVNELGMTCAQQHLFHEAMCHSQGLIFVTGPTGSGKTTTLYTALKQLNSPEVNICSVEDPIEIQLPGINQVAINLKIGLTFATTLRAFLRQDPDIIMIGEARDHETAEIAVKAAQTGHLVLSTIHTNSATETLNRLANMGIPSYNIASCILLIIAQRLVRTLCENCKIIIELSEQALIAEGFLPEEVSQLVVYGPSSCEQCNDGYKGRVGIYELLPISTNIARLIMADANSFELTQQARLEKILTLRQHGLQKVKAGLTSLQEVRRVVKC